MTNNIKHQNFTLTKIAAATFLALGLVGCGSGGSGSGANPPGNPDIGGPGNPGNPGNPGGPGQPGNGGGNGGGGTTPGDRWSPVPIDDARYNSQHDGTGSKAAHAAGFTGQGVTVGVVDSGVYTKNKALDAKSIPLYRMTTDGRRVQISPDAPLIEQDGGETGHGTSIAQIIAGKATAKFQGGVAPDANLVAVNVREDDGTIWSNTVHEAVEFLSQEGASVINVSLGGGAGLVPDFRSPALDNAVRNGSLVVFSTGNDGSDQPSSNSLYPVKFGDVKSGILAVTALETDGQGNFTQRWEKSNACGAAAEWCLSAPGPVRVLDTAVTEASEEATISGRIGTSNAAAMVSGVAALTKSAFPWMTNENLQQTLLTTATYLPDGSEVGGEKFNATFGWGRVNAEKAVRGPGGFYFGQFTANVDSGSSVFSNDIDGSGSLTKLGGGSLTLAGNNTYTGPTFVNEGWLEVAGANAHSHFIVGQAAGLTGNGSVARLSSEGVIAASSAGSLNVAGDFTQSASGTFIPLKGSPLVVQGTAQLAGAVDYRNYGYVNGSESDTIVVSNNLVLNGLSAQAPAVLSVNHQASDNNLVANITRVSATEVSGLVDTASELASAKQLDAAFATADDIDAKAKAGHAVSAEERQFLNTLASVQTLEEVSEVREAASLLSGNSYALMPAVLMETQRLDSAAVSDRMSKLNMGSGITEGPWATAHHVRNKLEPSGYGTAETKLTGIQIGFDKGVGDWLVGGYASYADATTDFADNGGRMDTEKYGFGLYAKRNFGDAYAQFQGGYQFGDADFKKLSLDGNSITAKPDLNGLHLGAEVGHGFDVGATRLTPFVGLAYDSVRLDGIDESGSALGMSIDKKTLSESSANVGLRASWAIDKWSRLGLHYKFDRVLSRKNQDLSASFLNGGSFSIDAPDYSKNRHTVGVNAQAVVGKNTVIGASFESRLSSDSKSHTMFLGLKHAF